MSLTRPATITTPLGDRLIFRSMQAHEALSHLFTYEVELLSTDPDIQASSLLGKSLTVHVDMGEHAPRHFNGIVARFAYAGTHGRYSTYHATLRPSLWLLSQTADCRVFQRVRAPELVMLVLRLHGLTDVQAPGLTREYPEREYVVQYRETAFAFLSRLMEDEGLYYYFTHREDGHTLVLADACSASDKVPGFETIPFYPEGHAAMRERDHIDAWRVSRQVVPTRYVLNAFDFMKPKADLTACSAVPDQHDQAETEMYDAGGAYGELQVGEHYARTRVEELQAAQEVFDGDGNVRGLAAGAVFSLSGFPRADLNREYLVVSAEHTITAGELESRGHDDESFRCRLSAQDASLPYRPRRVTPHPTIAGPQTAKVVGHQGSEICTDEYGRVKVQFHWDREGKSDQNSSCWVRVAQAWAGAHWGAIFIPRVGQEVVVHFLDGDPDRPIVTGSVYNRDNMPPYMLDKHATRSGIRTRSAKDGNPDNGNELRFEDDKGEEQLYLQAERDMDVLVKHDQSQRVMGNRTAKVEGDDEVFVVGKRTITSCSGELITTDQLRDDTVRGQFKQKIARDFQHTIGGDHLTAVLGKVDHVAVQGWTLSTPAKVEINAMSGMKVTAPGGIQTVSPNESVVAGITIKHVQTQNTVIGQKVEATGASMLTTGLKMEMAGVSLSYATVRNSNDALTVSQAQTRIVNGLMSLSGALMTILK
jgi:type VI secretion system secreted protein VgrG